MTEKYSIMPTRFHEMDLCVELVRKNWGNDSAERCLEQLAQATGGYWDPMFFTCRDVERQGQFVGFCALRRTMLMNGGWECIWVAVEEEYHGKGAGTLMTEHRINVARQAGGSFVTLVTQKPKYFNRFGFLTSQHIGNGWVIMTCQLRLADMDAQR